MGIETQARPLSTGATGDGSGVNDARMFGYGRTLDPQRKIGSVLCEDFAVRTKIRGQPAAADIDSSWNGATAASLDKTIAGLYSAGI